MADLLATGTAVAGYAIRELFRRDTACAEYLAVGRDRDRSVILKEYFPQAVARRLDGAAVSTNSPADQTQLEAGLERFLAQHQTIQGLAHGALQNIQECFRANGTAYAVLDHHEGETLLARLERDATLPVEDIHKILFPIVDGLERVHQTSLLHGRINLTNILIRTDGSPLLVGFGATASATAGPRRAFGARPRSDADLPSGGFVAPEQYSRRGRQGPWTDIYSLGAVFYQCVLGVAPTDAPGRAVHDDLEPAATLARGSYDPRLLAGIDAALALRVADRPHSLAVWRRSLTASTIRESGARMARGRMAARGPLTVPLVSSPRRNVSSFGEGTAAEREVEPRNISWAVPALAALVFIALITWLDTGVLRSSKDGHYQDSMRPGVRAVVDGVEFVPRHDPAASPAEHRGEPQTAPSKTQPGGTSVDFHDPPTEPHEPPNGPTGGATPDSIDGAIRDEGATSEVRLPNITEDGLEGVEAPGGGEPSVPPSDVDSAVASVEALTSIQGQFEEASGSLSTPLDARPVALDALHEQRVSMVGLEEVTDRVPATPHQRPPGTVPDPHCGSLTIDLNPPGADVTFVGSEAMRYHPGMELPEGEHRLRVELPDHRPEHRVVGVSGARRVQVALAPEPQPFSVAILPLGAIVGFADRDDSYAPGMRLSPGDYRVAVSLLG